MEVHVKSFSKVAIDPTCLNKLSKMVFRNTKINRNYGEYNNLMKFLTETGMNLFELVNMREEQFREIYNKIFGSTNTHDFGDTLKKYKGIIQNRPLRRERIPLDMRCCI